MKNWQSDLLKIPDFLNLGLRQRLLQHLTCVCVLPNVYWGGDVGPVDIDALIFVTQTPDWSIPATSHWLQDQLGLKADCICIDVNEGCAGFEHGYYLACTLLKAGNCKNVLLLAGDTISKVTNPEDRATRLIFGDAGTASIIGEMPCGSVFSIKSYGDRYNAIITENSRHRLSEVDKDGYLFLDGSGIMEFTLNEVYENIKEFTEYLHMGVDDIKLFACHQANKLILSSLAEQLDVAEDKVPFVAGNIGNTSSASIPLLLCGDAEYKMKNVMLCGFGVGLSCDLCLTDLSQTEFVGVVDYE